MTPEHIEAIAALRGIKMGGGCMSYQDHLYYHKAWMRRSECSVVIPILIAMRCRATDMEDPNHISMLRDWYEKGCPMP